MAHFIIKKQRWLIFFFFYIKSIFISRKQYMYNSLTCSTNTRIEPQIVGFTFISPVHFPFSPIVDQFLCCLSSSWYYFSIITINSTIITINNNDKYAIINDMIKYAITIKILIYAFTNEIMKILSLHWGTTILLSGIFHLIPLC